MDFTTSKSEELADYNIRKTWHEGRHFGRIILILFTAKSTRAVYILTEN
jgi:hypothetical protein